MSVWYGKVNGLSPAFIEALRTVARAGKEHGASSAGGSNDDPNFGGSWAVDAADGDNSSKIRDSDGDDVIGGAGVHDSLLAGVGWHSFAYISVFDCEDVVLILEAGSDGETMDRTSLCDFVSPDQVDFEWWRDHLTARIEQDGQMHRVVWLKYVSLEY